MHLKIGDPWPFASVRGVTGKPLDEPVWHALIVPPQREKNAAHKLGNSGVEVHYPTVESTRHVNGQPRKYVRPMISQIIYAKFRYQPHWDVMRDRRIITGVFSVGAKPLVLAPDDVSKVMGLPTEAERLEEERIDSARPRAGEQAEIISGPLTGFFVDVTKVQAGRVWFAMIGGLKGDAKEDMVRRVV